MKKIIFLLLPILILSCKDDNDTINGAGSIHLVTGIGLKQNYEDPEYVLGNPNTFTDGKFTMYPNPARSQVFIASDETISNIWIVPANAEKSQQDTNFGSFLNSGSYDEALIGSNAILSLNEGTIDTSVGLDNLQTGYYKVFVKVNGEIFWDNLYHMENEVDYEQELNAILDFWE